jgi:hypothetical protein
MPTVGPAVVSTLSWAAVAMPPEYRAQSVIPATSDQAISWPPPRWSWMPAASMVSWMERSKNFLPLKSARAVKASSTTNASPWRKR